ncbi:hypothetical protein JJB07_06390 [Tumebacillus sp. ITR2]|uniref:Integral membrane protein n=1 Tax=Tumebacillus amylolyticus TaxID=2801339 RepID=A0ABS1J7M1_9BACL|nr:hypothetical protein [Tumebacillus amylolyticus]MBL0386281.1 hypothetical protein [Tumebacillus amylolyticus]
MLVTVALMSLVTFLVNIPLGMWRVNTRPFTFGWFLATLASLPLIVFLRQDYELTLGFVALLVVLGIIGQTFGGRFARKRVVVGRWS